MPVSLQSKSVLHIWQTTQSVPDSGKSCALLLPELSQHSQVSNIRCWHPGLQVPDQTLRLAAAAHGQELCVAINFQRQMCI